MDESYELETRGALRGRGGFSREKYHGSLTDRAVSVLGRPEADAQAGRFRIAVGPRQLRLFAGSAAFGGVLARDRRRGRVEGRTVEFALRPGARDVYHFNGAASGANGSPA